MLGVVMIENKNLQSVDTRSGYNCTKPCELLEPNNIKGTEDCSPEQAQEN